MAATQENAPHINHKAKMAALVFGLLNVFIYSLIIALIFLSPPLLEKLFEYPDLLAIVTLGSFVLSLFFGYAFPSVPPEKKTNLALIYTALLIINLACFLLYYGFSNMSLGVFGML